MNQQPLIETQRNDYPPDFEQVWQAYPNRGRTKGANDNKIAAARAYHQRIRQGHDPQAIIQGVEAYAEYVRAQGQEGTPYVKQCATFLGPDCHFLCEWECPQESVDSSAWDDVLLAASRGTGERSRFVEEHPEYREALNAVGGLRQIGLMTEWQQKEARQKFISALEGK